VQVAKALRDGAQIVSDSLNGLWAGSPSETKFISLEEVLAAQHEASGDTGELVLDAEDLTAYEDELY